MNDKINRLFGISFLVLVLILWASYVFATTIVLPPTSTFVDEADVIATGTVKAITSYKTDDGIRTSIGIKVSEPIKGITSDYLEVREIGGKVGEEVTWIGGSPQYKIGEKVTVLLKRQADGSLRTHLFDTGRIPEKKHNTINSLFALSPSYKDRVLLDIENRKQELKKSPSKPLALGFMVQPAPLSGPAESLTEFRFMTDPPSRWLDNPVKVYGDPVGDKKYGPIESRRSVQDATESWSSVGNVTFQYSGDTPAVGYTCVPGKLLVQFGDVANDIEDPKQCSGVLAIGGFCAGRIVDGKYDITGGGVVFNNGWENCHFWTEDNITEVMTHEFGHAIGLSHSAESGQPTTQYTEEALMYYMAHFDGRRNELKSYDRGAIVALYGTKSTPTPSSTPRPTATRTQTPSPTQPPVPTASQTPTTTPKPTPTKIASGPFYEISSLYLNVSYNNAFINLIVNNEPIQSVKPRLILYSNETKKAILLEDILNIQLNNNKLSFRARSVPSGFMTKNVSVAVITGTRLALVDLVCEHRFNTYICK